jgi:hypothetical protein
MANLNSVVRRVALPDFQVITRIDSALPPPELGNFVSGVFTLVLAKLTRRSNLVDRLSIGGGSDSAELRALADSAARSICKGTQLLYFYDKRNRTALRRPKSPSKCPLNIACCSGWGSSDGTTCQIVGQRSGAGSADEGGKCWRTIIDFQIGKRSAAVIDESDGIRQCGSRQRGGLVYALFQPESRIRRRSHGAQVADRISCRQRGIGIGIGEAGRDDCIVRGVKRCTVGDHLFHDQAEVRSGSDGWAAFSPNCRTSSKSPL